MLPNPLQNPPAEPKLYYITHIENLRSIFSSGFLYSDARRIDMGLISKNIGMITIKERRLDRHLLGCYPDTTVGQYVPFYFCPRSVMLFVLYKGNNDAITYRDGQDPIVHLQIDMHRAIEWAESSGNPWAFSDRNAAARVAAFYNDLEHFNQINWNAVAADDWREPEIKEGKQAEFLIYEQVPYELIERIGVINHHRSSQVEEIIAESAHSPAIAVERTWYY